MGACPLIMRTVSAAHLGWKKAMSLSSGSIFRVVLHRVNSVAAPEPPQARVLALWSYGMVLTHTCGITTIVVVLAQLLGQNDGTVRWSRRWPPRWLPPASKGAMTLQTSSPPQSMHLVQPSRSPRIV